MSVGSRCQVVGIDPSVEYFSNKQRAHFICSFCYHYPIGTNVTTRFAVSVLPHHILSVSS